MVCRIWRHELVFFLFVVLLALPATDAWAKGGKGKGKGKTAAADEDQGADEGKGKQNKHQHRHRKQKGDKYMPKGLTDKEKKQWVDGKPPGWSQGKKAGWQGGDMPPGLAKKGDLPAEAKDWSQEKKQKWEDELAAKVKKIRDLVGKIKGMTKEDVESAAVSVEQASRKGVPVEKVYDVVKTIAEKGVKGQGVEKTTRALAYAVGKKVDFTGLGELINKKVEEGVDEDGLATDIYKAIDEEEEK